MDYGSFSHSLLSTVVSNGLMGSSIGNKGDINYINIKIWDDSCFFFLLFLEQIQGDFEVLLEETCAGRHELRDRLPFGSLSNLARSHGVIRYGQAHTAGSDALVTLDLFFRISKSDDTHVESNKFDMESGKFDPSNSSAAAVHLKPSDFGDRSVAESRVASAL